MLTNELLSIITASAPSRIINVSSMGNYLFSPASGLRLDDIRAESDYCPWERYGISKLGNIVHAVELQRRLDAAGSADVTVVAVHPGVDTSTSLMRHSSLGTIMRILTYRRALTSLAVGSDNKSTQGCIAPYLACALGPNVRKGRYYADCQIETTDGRLHPLWDDEALGRALWASCEAEVRRATATATATPPAGSS